MPPRRGARFEEAWRALQTLESRDPTELRRRALEAIVAFAGADFGLFFRYDASGGELHYAANLGTTAESHRVFGELAGSPMLVPMTSHLRPPPAQVNRFVDVTRLGLLPLPPHHPLHQTVYGPLGVVGSQRALCFDGRRFLGYVTAQFDAAGRFTPSDTAALNALMPPLQALLVEADRLEREALASPIHLVVRPSGQLAFATPAAERWLTPARRERLADIVRRADAAPSFSPVQDVVGARATCVRMHGAETVYLVSLEAIVAPELAPDNLLSPRQREIAEYAVAGATAAEIGQTLGLSAETVRAHLKEIYRRLDVATRVELARALAPSEAEE